MRNNMNICSKGTEYDCSNNGINTNGLAICTYKKRCLNKERVKMKSCSCSLCQRERKIEELIKRKNFDRLVQYTKELSRLLTNSETDAQHYSLILHGNWPNSIKIMEAALQQAKENILLNIDKDALNKLYFSVCGSISKQKALKLLLNSDLVKLANEHLKTTSPHNPGCILTYNNLKNACVKKNVDIDEMLKAIMYKKCVKA
jgi:hypothetical protein